MLSKPPSLQCHEGCLVSAQLEETWASGLLLESQGVGLGWGGRTGWLAGGFGKGLEPTQQGFET